MAAMRDYTKEREHDYTVPLRSEEVESGQDLYFNPARSLRKRRHFYCTLFTALFCFVGLLYSFSSPSSSRLQFGKLVETPASNARPSDLTIQHHQAIPLPSQDCAEGVACFWQAPYLSPSALMADPSVIKYSNKSNIPKLLHQSWGEKPINAKVKAWSDKCRMLHPDWQWVLWKNKDNRELVEKHYPWFLASFDALDTDIKRADAARNLYMNAFGGVYFDFDIECIRPFDELFEKKQDAEQVAKEVGGNHMEAYFGQMGDDVNFEHSIPNDWMASSTGHPFFLLPLNYIVQVREHATMIPEAETGPIALRAQILKYKQGFEAKQEIFDRYLTTLPINYTPRYAPGARTASVKILAKEYIHPFHWSSDGPNGQRNKCLGFSGSFDAEACKESLQVFDKGTYAIAYWTHSWGL
ncbi:hypothetical protein CBS101457_004984 [Exobasidium rhododendri]|nr:hypothetical protein CBS101457_004984 [Exobasidium rhododendri]